ncbi:coagulation factor VIII-like [Hippocampus comes]|uniref:coagulation factor VIII-like n=1 Tax=Hippocampus comes TaxID=109280 RepID=UPI00094DFFD8|nr:PREDICTED: coagulation factor VIII-like [Hippocampus comes]
MRLSVWTGDPGLFSILLLALLASSPVHVGANQQDQVKKREYYIAAVEIDWNYNGNDTHRFSPTYKKVVFREYEKDFKQAKDHDPSLGLLGPTLRAEQDEILVVTFRNMASEPHNLHPHGIAYGKNSEGEFLLRQSVVDHYDVRVCTCVPGASTAKDVGSELTAPRSGTYPPTQVSLKPGCGLSSGEAQALRVCRLLAGHLKDAGRCLAFLADSDYWTAAGTKKDDGWKTREKI